MGNFLQAVRSRKKRQLQRLFGKVEQSISPFALKSSAVLDELRSKYNDAYFTNLSNTLTSPSLVNTLISRTLNDPYEAIVKSQFSNLDDMSLGRIGALGNIGSDIFFKFDDIYKNVNNIDSIVENRLSKTNTALAMAGLLNTPATQRTQADIISELNFQKAGILNDILKSKTAITESFSKQFGDLSGLYNELSIQPYKLDVLRGQSLSSILNALSSADAIKLQNALLPFDMQLKIALAYAGVPVDTVVNPGRQGLAPVILDTIAKMKMGG